MFTCLKDAFPDLKVLENGMKVSWDKKREELDGLRRIDIPINQESTEYETFIRCSPDLMIVYARNGRLKQIESEGRTFSDRHSSIGGTVILGSPIEVTSHPANIKIYENKHFFIEISRNEDGKFSQVTVYFKG